jgi:hypothetical protein
MVAGFDASSAHELAAAMKRLGKAGDLSKAIGLLSTVQLEVARVMTYLKMTDCEG